VKRSFMRQAAVAVSATALAVGTSTLFGGVALAAGHNHHSHDHNGPTYDAGSENDYGGRGGAGGMGRSNCLLPLGVSAGVIGQGGEDSQCNAGGGNAGAGGSGDG